MKKLFKVVLALTFCLSCLALTACAKSDEKKIVGTWETTADISKTMMGSESDREALEKYFPDGLSVMFAFTFNDDQTAKMEIPDASIEAFKADILVGMKAMMSDMLGDSAEQYAAEMGYSSLDEYVEESSDSLFDVSDLKDSSSKSGKYEIADGKLYFYESTKNENDYIKYEFVSDSELKFTEIGESEGYPFEIPTILKKTK